jgi:4'-phosphopantetheinyl transferase
MGNLTSSNFEPRTISCWESIASSQFALAQDEVHLWCASLDPSDAIVSDLEQTLAPEDLERARRFKFSKDQRRFILGRGLLRALLGGYASCAAAAVVFEYGPSGKPGRPQQFGSQPLQFNLSHSGSLVMIALSRTRPVGVDVEQVDPTIDVEQMIDQFFTRGEVADIKSRGSSQQLLRFFEIWTRKEALIKAQGKALLTELHGLDTSIFGDARHGSSALPIGDPFRCWSVSQFTPAWGYVAALAVSEGNAEVSCRELRWSESSSDASAPGLRAIW